MFCFLHERFLQHGVHKFRIFTLGTYVGKIQFEKQRLESKYVLYIPQ